MHVDEKELLKPCVCDVAELCISILGLTPPQAIKPMNDTNAQILEITLLLRRFFIISEPIADFTKKPTNAIVHIKQTNKTSIANPYLSKINKVSASNRTANELSEIPQPR